MENKNKIYYSVKMLLILVLFVFIEQRLVAQQQVQYTQYMYTPSLVNPAYVGLDEEMKVSILHRSQWVGIKGAPTSQTLFLSTPIGERLGFGFGVTRDEIGPANETNATLDLSYVLQLNDRGLYFSFGMKGGLQLLNVDFDKLITHNPNDPSLNENINSRVTPNIGTGFYLYSNDWYLGFSAPNLLRTKHYNKSSISTVSSSTHFYFIGGKSFNLNNNTKLKPAFMLRSVTGTPIAVDLSLNFLFNNNFTTGISYRPGATISGLLDFKINKQLSLGYAYDYDISDIGYFSGGSHEILLRYRFNKIIENVKQPSWLF